MSFEQTYHQLSKHMLELQSPSLYTVIELSRSHMSRYKENMIIISGFGVKKIDKTKTHFENRYSTYSNIKYGNILGLLATNKMDAILLQKNEINQILFVVELKEICKHFQDSVVIIPSQPLPAKNNKNQQQHRSGYIMICREILDSKK